MLSEVTNRQNTASTRHMTILVSRVISMGCPEPHLSLPGLTGQSSNPGVISISQAGGYWIPAFAGMTQMQNDWMAGPSPAEAVAASSGHKASARVGGTSPAMTEKF